MVGRIRRGVIGAAALMLALAPAALAADHAVDIAGFAFSPQSVTVAVGDTVTWSNADVQSHTVTANGGAFDTGTIGGGTSKSLTFSTVDTFAYHCRIHPSMTGTIIVQAAAAPPPTDTDASPSPSGGGDASLALLAIIAAVGFLVARRRFSAPRSAE
jgi:plastocyanin